MRILLTFWYLMRILKLFFRVYTSVLLYCVVSNVNSVPLPAVKANQYVVYRLTWPGKIFKVKVFKVVFWQICVATTNIKNSKKCATCWAVNTLNNWATAKLGNRWLLEFWWRKAKHQSCVCVCYYCFCIAHWQYYFWKCPL